MVGFEPGSSMLTFMTHTLPTKLTYYNFEIQIVELEASTLVNHGSSNSSIIRIFEEANFLKLL